MRGTAVVLMLTLVRRLRQPKRSPHHALLQQVLNDLQNDPSAWPFVKPVDSGVVTDYYSVIKSPMGEKFAGFAIQYRTVQSGGPVI